MQNRSRISLSFLGLAAIALCGCSSIVNLTPSRYPASPNGFYRVEAKWKSNQQSIRSDSFKPEVVVGLETYPMHPIPVVKDRWEAYIPAKGENAVVYHYQFNFVANGFRNYRPDSKRSPDYTLKIK